MVMLNEPMAVFAFCAAVCALVFWSTEQAWAKRFYGVVPAVVLVYYLPALASTLGILPTSSPAYDWMRDYLLPFSLFLLMITTDIPSVLRIGPKAIAVMLFGTLGIVVGGPVAFVLFRNWLPPDAWQGMAARSGSWIGGGGNFAAIKESVGASDTIVGPIIVVDTAVGYTWTGVLLFLANYQKIFDRYLRADSSIVEELNQKLRGFREQVVHPIRLYEVSSAVGIGFVGAVTCTYLASWIYSQTNSLMEEWIPSLSSVFSSFTWLVILLSTLGILLSFTKVRRLETGGVSKLGYAALFLFLTSIGAKADLKGIASAPELLLVGVVWILVHVTFLWLGARLVRAPMFLLAIGSQANIGGAATAPIVAAAYYESMAPVGLLMGIFGYLIGNYAGLLCAFLLSVLAG
jgi:uncharacterized membrane protein